MQLVIFEVPFIAVNLVADLAFSFREDMVELVVTVSSTRLIELLST